MDRRFIIHAHFQFPAAEPVDENTDAFFNLFGGFRLFKFSFNIRGEGFFFFFQGKQVRLVNDLNGRPVNIQSDQYPDLFDPFHGGIQSEKPACTEIAYQYIEILCMCL